MPLSSHIKPEPYRAPTDAQIAKAREMYKEGFAVSRILAACAMSLGTLYYWLDGGPLDDGHYRLPPLPRRRASVLGKRRRALRTDHVSLASRLFSTAERQVRDIEQRLLRPGGGAERERDVRMLSVLVRTLRDLSAFHAGSGGEAPEAVAPQDIAEMRRNLADKLEAILARREEAGEQGTDRPT